MKKTNPSLADEAFALIADTIPVFHAVSDNFLKCTEEGCIKIRKESTRLAITMKLEMKKEAK